MRGMAPLLMAARQGHLLTVSKILSLCPDCCEKVDNKSLNVLHYLAFRGSPSPFGNSVFKSGHIEIVYGSVKTLMELEGAFGMTPQDVDNAVRSQKHHHKQKQIKELLEEIENDQVAEEPVHHFTVRNNSIESLEKTGNAHLVAAALIATVAFAAAITVPGGLESEKGSNRGTPILIQEAAFKAFVVTNAMAFIFSVSALTTYFGVLDHLFTRFIFWREAIILNRTWSVSMLLNYATLAMVIAFSTGSYVVLKPSHELAIVSYLICPAFLLCKWTALLLECHLFKLGGIGIAYGSVRNLMELEGAFGMTPQEVYNALQYEKHHHKQFNVCGIAKEDRAGCRGVLRDKEGVARALFSGSVAANDADVAEIGAVMRPWSLQAIFAGIENDMLKAGNVVFSLADKKGNEMASSLAIAGYNRVKMFKAW
ncbi:ankyrin repeat-containing protein NPR4 [Gossypium raimondii]|uniref:ankyrin repeat-containing protein NPR4 n=1 Tax=Gossypium raimondii TaxID=29730 RepID=UPI00227B9C1B|nr:ankyrin repeat-containing protein NPR4 [Gossypium raimondii]